MCLYVEIRQNLSSSVKICQVRQSLSSSSKFVICTRRKCEIRPNFDVSACGGGPIGVGYGVPYYVLQIIVVIELSALLCSVKYYTY